MSSSKYSPGFLSSPLFGWCQRPVGASTIICLQLADGARWPFTSSQSISLLLLPLSLLLHHPRPTLSQLKPSSAAQSQSDTRELSRLAAGCKIAGGQRGRGVSVCLLYERWWSTEWPPWHTHKHMHTHAHTQIDIQLHLPFSFNYVCESMSVLDESAALSTKGKVKGREGRWEGGGAEGA